MEAKKRLTLKVKEVAELLGLPPRTVYDLCHREDFPSFTRGRTVLISRSGLEAWVEAQARQGMNDRRHSGPRRAGDPLRERDEGVINI